MLKIRLAQTGTKNRKAYRVVAIDEQKRRDGKHLEILGFVNPLVKPTEVKIDTKRIEYWVSKGAQVTDAVKKYLKQ